jgi:hypothetical protein
MEPKQKNSLFTLTAIWLAFVVFLKIMEHQRAFNNVQIGFRFDLYVILPILLIVTIIILWKNWDDMDDGKN